MDVAKGISEVLQNRKRKSDANAKMLAGIDPRKLKAMTKRPMGLPSAPVPQVQKAAQGGIVGFQAGNEVMGLSGMDRTGFGDPTVRMPDNSLSEVPEMTEPGGVIVDTTSDVGRWIMSNPVEAGVLAITAHPAMKVGQAAFKLSRGALNTIKNIIARNPRKTLGAGAVGAFAGQDVVNPALQNLPETMKSAGEKAMDIGKGIATLPKKAYEGARNLLGIESPGLFTPDAAPASMPQVDTTTTDASPAVALESVRDAQG